MVTITIRCCYCGSDKLKRNGHAPNGKQRYYCKECKKQSQENPTPYAYSKEKREEILRAYFCIPKRLVFLEDRDYIILHDRSVDRHSVIPVDDSYHAACALVEAV
jgi:InsA N-terminal domain